MSEAANLKPIRAIATFELSKGAIALSAGLGFLFTEGRNWYATFENLLGGSAQLFHLSQRLIRFLEDFGSGQQRLVAIGLLAYAAVRMVEGIGLWRQCLWAKWLGAVSGGIYLPFEIYELLVHPGYLTLIVVAVNLAIVLYLLAAVSSERKQAKTAVRQRPSPANR